MLGDGIAQNRVTLLLSEGVRSWETGQRWVGGVLEK